MKGETKVTPMSPFLGSILTPLNTNEYKRKQIEHFIERFTADVVAERDKIKEQEDKTPEEIEVLVQEYNEKQSDETEVYQMAIRFATKMVTKENKHFKAYLEGSSFFTYNGQRYPVLTELMVERTRSVHEIIEAAKRNELRNREMGSTTEGEDSPGSLVDIPEGDNETLRSDPSDIENIEPENNGGSKE